MRTPEEDPMPSTGNENHDQERAYLPSPPVSPATPLLHREQYFEDVNDDNTAAGMAGTQEQIMYQEGAECPSENFCGHDSEKMNSQTYGADGTTLANVPSLSYTPLANGEPEQQISSNDSVATDAPSSEHTQKATSDKTSHTPLIMRPHHANVPTALFSPSPPPTSASPGDSVLAPISTASDSIDGLTSEFSKVRLTPSFTSSFFRPGSRFTGTQQSDRQIYNVDVEINNVSIPDSSVSGYLKICGLTDTHPTLTTYFEGEIIGTKHTFQTRHPGWGATDKTDMQHWARFPAWRPLAKEARRPGFSFGKGWWNRENIFMRWKEHFLVPDHRVRSIQGASFEGFYYICYNQVEGRISGIYFHAKSENSGINDRYQQLELKHVPDKGCLGAMEFR